jgi:hypothetical protein
MPERASTHGPYCGSSSPDHCDPFEQVAECSQAEPPRTASTVRVGCASAAATDVADIDTSGQAHGEQTGWNGANQIAEQYGDCGQGESHSVASHVLCINWINTPALAKLRGKG